ncbi:50S ribosomal protein L11 methyltransferase [Porphyromonadaceae bacterium]
MEYIEVRLTATPSPSEDACDLMAALLGEVGFESFTPTTDGILAYIQTALFDEEAVQNVLTEYPLEYAWAVETNAIADQNWNEEWEKHYFQPIVVDDECVIHSSFHTDVPACRYHILIDPKMSFGTGHHETTYQILKEILKADLTGKSVLDMGCGTAVLAILASMKGATDITAIDIDEWAYENALENIRLNNTPHIHVLLGGAELLGEKRFDVIFANINRNILLADMKHYAACMHEGSEIYFSGFYTEDLPLIRQEAEANGMEYLSHGEKNNWVAARFRMKG